MKQVITERMGTITPTKEKLGVVTPTKEKIIVNPPTTKKDHKKLYGETI